MLSTAGFPRQMMAIFHRSRTIVHSVRLTSRVSWRRNDHVRTLIALSIWLTASPLHMLHAQVIEYHTTDDDTEVLVVPNQTLDIAIGHEVGDIQLEISR